MPSVTVSSTTLSTLLRLEDVIYSRGMELILDVHIHSHYSRATSKEMNIAALHRWGKQKGLTVMGTGDFTHPEWFAELQEKLEPAEDGLFTLKPEFSKEQEQYLPSNIRSKPIRFLLTVEISNIYSKNGKVRKLHNLVIVPSFQAASKLNARLSQIGNLASDGRPILGLDSKELLKITLDTDPDALFVPAHIWTPWFGMFGSQSGFDAVEEAFEELSPHIRAIETGLSSDPYMNWRVGDLDSVTMISNSDAHSPGKLGREANIVNCELTYRQLIDAIKTGDERFVGTIEFYPEEGKYHYDGHRSCNVRLSPSEAKKLGNICPVCGKPLVLGVEHRVEDIATRPAEFIPKGTRRKTVEYIVPLPEILMQIYGVKSEHTRPVQQAYQNLSARLGDEFSILRAVELPAIRDAGFPDVATAIGNMRSGKVTREPGYDGVFGTIKVITQDEMQGAQGQLSLV